MAVEPFGELLAGPQTDPLGAEPAWGFKQYLLERSDGKVEVGRVPSVMLVEAHKDRHRSCCRTPSCDFGLRYHTTLGLGDINTLFGGPRDDIKPKLPLLSSWSQGVQCLELLANDFLEAHKFDIDKDLFRASAFNIKPKRVSSFEWKIGSNHTIYGTIQPVKRKRKFSAKVVKAKWLSGYRDPEYFDTEEAGRQWLMTTTRQGLREQAQAEVEKGDKGQAVVSCTRCSEKKQFTTLKTFTDHVKKEHEAKEEHKDDE